MRREGSGQIVEDIIFTEMFYIEGGNFNKAGEVSSRIKAIIKSKGIADDIARKAALVAYESEINLVSYARQGVMKLSIYPHSVIIETIDEGEGIHDIELAMQEGYSTASDKIREMGFGAGMGLCNIKNYSDHFDLRSIIGQGTYLKMVIDITENDAR